MKSVKIISLLLALCTLFALCACGKTEEEKKIPTSDKATGSPEDIALESEHFKVTMGEAAYAFAMNYNDLKSDKSSIDMYNIDVNSTLKDQYYYDDHTWFDEIEGYTVDYLKEMLCWCEAAYEAGIELDDADKEDIEAVIDSWVQHAKDYDYTIEKLLEKNLLPDVTLDAMRTFLEKQTLSFKYQQKNIYDLKYTEEDYNSYLDEKGEDLYYVDYYSYQFSEQDTPDAKAKADELAKITDPEEFIQYVSDYLWETKKLPIDEQDLESYKTTYFKRDTTDFSKFAFDAKTGDTYVKYLNVDGLYTTYLITKAKYLEESHARTIAYLAAEKASHGGSVDSVKEYLNGIVDEWKNGDDTSSENFISLCNEKSEAKEAKSNGCVASNLIKSDYVSFSQQLIDWLYEDGRQVGDVGVVKGNDTQYYAVYYMEEGLLGWQCEAEAYMKTNLSDKLIEEFLEKYTVSIDEGVMYEINA